MTRLLPLCALLAGCPTQITADHPVCVGETGWVTLKTDDETEAIVTATERRALFTGTATPADEDHAFLYDQASTGVGNRDKIPGTLTYEFFCTVPGTETFQVTDGPSTTIDCEVCGVEDAIDDFFDSISANDATYTPGFLDITSTAATKMVEISAVQEETNDDDRDIEDLFPCGGTFGEDDESEYVCSLQTDSFDVEQGAYFFTVQTAEPLDSTVDYGIEVTVAIDSDALPANNWVAQGEFDYDTWQGMDRIYQFYSLRDDTGYHLDVTQFDDSLNRQIVPSAARVIRSGDSVTFVIPVPEIPSEDATMRFLTFGSQNFDPSARGADTHGENSVSPVRRVDGSDQ